MQLSIRQRIAINLAITFAVVLVAPQLIGAQTSEVDALRDSLNVSAGAQGAGFATNAAAANLSARLGAIINYLFGLVGIVFLAYALIGGVLWIMAGGNEEKVGRAKGFIRGGIQGVIITGMSYAMAYFVIQVLTLATNRTN